MVPKCCCTFKVLFPQHVHSPTWVIPVLILVAPPAGSLQAGVALHRQGVVGTLGTDYFTTPPAVMTAVELCWGGGEEDCRFAIFSFNARARTHTRVHTHMQCPNLQTLQPHHYNVALCLICNFINIVGVDVLGTVSKTIRQIVLVAPCLSADLAVVDAISGEGDP